MFTVKCKQVYKSVRFMRKLPPSIFITFSVVRKFMGMFCVYFPTGFVSPSLGNPNPATPPTPGWGGEEGSASPLVYATGGNISGRTVKEILMH